MPNLRQRLALTPASRTWLAEMSATHHYIHKPVHPKASPFGWAVTYDGQLSQPDGAPSGFIVFASIHFTKMIGEFGYADLPTRWQVLCLSRLWLHDSLPRNSETCVIAKELKLVQRRWLEVHPPRFPDQPYHILKVISYADGNYHIGTIYRAANFRELAPVQAKATTQLHGKATRGKGIANNATVYRFVYDLDPPTWTYDDLIQAPSTPRQLALDTALEQA